MKDAMLAHHVLSQRPLSSSVLVSFSTIDYAVTRPSAQIPLCSHHFQPISPVCLRPAPPSTCPKGSHVLCPYACPHNIFHQDFFTRERERAREGHFERDKIRNRRRGNAPVPFSRSSMSEREGERESRERERESPERERERERERDRGRERERERERESREKGAVA
jgi:hypothetical protein